MANQSAEIVSGLECAKAPSEVTEMPRFLSCPSCAVQLQVPDELLDKMARCPRCGATFPPLPGESPPSAPLADELSSPFPADSVDPAVSGTPSPHVPAQAPAMSTPEPVEDTDSLESWRTVRKGITLLLVVAAILLIVELIDSGIHTMGLPTGLQAQRQTRPTLAILAWTIGSRSLMLVLQALTILGYSWSGNAPRRLGARAFAKTALWFALAGVGAMILSCGLFGLQLALASERVDSVAPIGMSVLIIVLALALWSVSHFFYLYFLRAVALLHDAPGVARSLDLLSTATAAAIVGAVAFAFMAIMFFTSTVALLGAPGRPNGGAGDLAVFLVFSLLILGVWGSLELLLLLGAVIWYFVSLIQVRGMISRRLEQSMDRNES